MYSDYVKVVMQCFAGMLAEEMVSVPYLSLSNIYIDLICITDKFVYAKGMYIVNSHYYLVDIASSNIPSTFILLKTMLPVLWIKGLNKLGIISNEYLFFFFYKITYALNSICTIIVQIDTQQ
jgi:hypothetical protein